MVEPRPERWTGLILQRPACHRKDITMLLFYTILLSAAPLPPSQLGLTLKGPLTKNVEFAIWGHCGEGKAKALSRGAP